jgi:hypothetical protein
MHAAQISAPREIQAFAAGRDLWIVNLMGEPRRVRVQAAQMETLARLDANSFVAASQDPDALDRLQEPFAGEELELDAYACVRLRAA